MLVTRTFLFTDIEGSTRSEQREPVAWAGNHTLHNRIVEELIPKNNGEIYKNTGDGYQVAFVNAPEALKAALEVQRKLGSTTWEGTAPVRVRMGLHTGEAERHELGYDGDDLHKAARLMDAGHGGQVLLSLVTVELVREALRRDPAMAGVDLRELGVYTLRDIERPERIFQLVASGLQSGFPPLRVERAFFTNLPSELGPFIGRREELRALREELSRTRLLTITGAGGVGKTRMATQLAREEATNFEDGIGLVELGSISDGDLVVQTVASVFGVRESGASTLRESLIFYLQKKAALLVFDNCEHLLDACADLISTLLSKSSRLKVIVTSRERLDIDGETVYSLQGMPVPDAAGEIPVNDLSSYAAIELFATEAANSGAPFAVTKSNAGKIAEICKHLDGNPLAIKLAASLTSTLTVDEMLVRLRERFQMLVQGQRQVIPRHRTLKAAMDWSYELLTPEEAAVFRRLAVFSGAWSLKAAESVCIDEGFTDTGLVPVLNSLVRKNLVVKVSSEGESRFNMLETVREYAEMQFLATDEVEKLRHEHAKYFVSFAAHVGSSLWGPSPQVGLSRLEQDYDDLVAALEWARKSEVGKDSGLGLQLAAALGPFWERRGFLSEGRDRLRQALRARRQPEHDRYRVEALEAAARLAFLQNDYREAIELDEKSLKIRRQLAAKSEDTRLKHGVVGALNKIGLAAMRGGDYAMAEQRLLEAMDLARETKHTRGMVGALNHLAELAWRQGDYERAKERYRESLVYARQQRGKQREQSTLDALLGQARLLMYQRKYDEATELFTECLEIRKEQRNNNGLAFTLSDLSEVSFRNGDFENARRYAEESLRLRQELRTEWGIANSLHRLAQAKHKLGLYEEALAHLRDGLLIFERIQYRKGIAECLMRIAAIRCDLGEKAMAARLFGAAEALLDSLGAQLAEDQRDYYERAILASVRDQLDDRLWAAGRDTEPETAIRLAQQGIPAQQEDEEQLPLAAAASQSSKGE